MYQINFNKPVKIHFMGIGGISMSCLAEILHAKGFTVVGSDAHEPKYIADGFDRASEVLKECGFHYYTTFDKRIPEFHKLQVTVQPNCRNRQLMNEQG